MSVSVLKMRSSHFLKFLSTVYFMQYLCSNDQHPALRAHLGRCLLENQVQSRGPQCIRISCLHDRTTPGVQQLQTIHNHLLTCEKGPK